MVIQTDFEGLYNSKQLQFNFKFCFKKQLLFNTSSTVKDISVIKIGLICLIILILLPETLSV